MYPEAQKKTKEKDNTCLIMFIIYLTIALIIGGFVTFFFISSYNESSNNSFNNSYILEIENYQTIDLSIPLINKQYKTEIDGYIQNTKRKNTFIVNFCVYDENNSLLHKSSKTRVLTRNQVFEFSFTAYTEEEPNRYNIYVSEG